MRQESMCTASLNQAEVVMIPNATVFKSVVTVEQNPKHFLHSD